MPTSAYGIRGTGQFAGKVTLPRHTFAPIHVQAGETRAFYIRIPDFDTTNRVSTDNLGSNLGGVWFENEYLSVHEGVYKSNWGKVSSTATKTYRFIGSFYTVPEGTPLPTVSPTVSDAPSKSSAPSTLAPTVRPSVSIAPSGFVDELTTPEEGNSYEGAYGYMFDVVGKGTT